MREGLRRTCRKKGLLRRRDRTEENTPPADGGSREARCPIGGARAQNVAPLPWTGGAFRLGGRGFVRALREAGTVRCSEKILMRRLDLMVALL